MPPNRPRCSMHFCYVSFLQERTEFVWGGCMLFRAAEMRGDARGILKVGVVNVLVAQAGLLGKSKATCLLPLLAAIMHCRQHSTQCWAASAPGVCFMASQPSCNEHHPLTVQAWEDGGYSDDLTVASKCTELQLPIYCPGYAIFPQWCAGG